MSEHEWTLEHLATYAADGLSAGERERVDRHTVECAACREALDEAGFLDDSLAQLFRPIQPGPALEDRMIRSLRSVSLPRWRGFLPLPVAVGVAAVLFLGFVGAVLSHGLETGTLRFPGEESPRLTQESGTDRNRKSAGHFWFMQGGPDAPNSEFAGVPVSKPAQIVEVETLADEIRRKVHAAPVDTLEAGRPDDSRTVLSAESAQRTRGPLRWKEPTSTVTPTPAVRNGSVGPEMLRSYAIMGDPKPESGKGQDQTPPNAYYRLVTPSDGPALPTVGGQVDQPTQHMGERPTGSPVLSVSPYFKPGTLLALPMRTGQSTNKVPVVTTAPVPVAPAIDPQQLEPKTPDEERKLGRQPTGLTGGGQEPSKEAPQVAPRKIVIRSGTVEFEIDSFDDSVVTVTKLVGAIPQGYVATVNSDKLPNGKVRGSIVVRVPPERLDSLVLELRKELGKTGQLKSQHIASQDITKQYTDLESRLRAARTMEERLIQIIKSGKGEIKDLLAAEKELGVWRTKIEEFEGELRYYSSMVSLSTLTISLFEKELRAPSVVTETERVNLGVEVEDVDKAQQTVVATVAELKGRITKSELKQHAAGQFSATMQFEVAPEKSGLMRDRLRQLGVVSRLEIDRLQQAQDGSGPPTDARSRRAETQFLLSLYNIVNVAPRETIHLNLAAADAESAYRLVLARVQKTTGRILSSNLNRQRTEQITGTLSFEVPTAEADAVLRELREVGEVLRLQVTENPDAQNVTRSKRGFQVQVWSLWQVPPRETTVLQVATKDVPAAYRFVQEAVTKAKGRIHHSQLNEQDKQNVTGMLDFEIRRPDEAAIDAAFARGGEVFSRNVQRAQESENITDSKVRLQVTFINQAKLPARETIVLGIEVANVETAVSLLTALAREAQGQVVESQVASERSGRVTARLGFDVPLAAASGLSERLKQAGTVRVQQSSRNPQAPDGSLALARIEVTLSNTELIVPRDEGLWPQIRSSLQYSVRALLWSLSFLILGVCVVVPWAAILYVVYRLVMRFRRKPESTATVA